MTIRISDLRRAILNGGDISSFADVYRRALGNPPVGILSNFDLPIALPRPVMLPSHVEKEHGSIDLTLDGIDLRIAAVGKYGNNTGKYVEHIINDTNPDIIAVDSCALELGAHILYASSLPCAVGLPVQAQVLDEASGKTYADRFLYPNSTIGIAVIEGWLREIPILPIGHPVAPIQLEFDPWGGNFDPDYADRNTWESNQYLASNTFEHNVKADTSLQEGNNRAREAGLQLMTTVHARRRNTVMEEAIYASSRIVDIAADAGLPGRKIRLLALVDIAHYVDVADITALAGKGALHDIYIPRRAEAAEADVFMAGTAFDHPGGNGGESGHETTLAQRLFKEQFDRFIQARDAEILPESKVDGLVSRIAESVRTHPDIARGFSVRGTIAFKEILRGLSDIHGEVTQKHLIKAAFITLPPRISLKRKGNGAVLVGDIVNEVLYDFHFYRRQNGTDGELSAADILTALKQLDGLPPEQSKDATPQGKSPAVMSEAQRNREALTYLEEMDYVRKDEQGQYVFTRKALEFLISGLEEKLESGMISLEEFHRQKSQLMQQLKNITEVQNRMSRGELANTIIEMIDAQDKQWNSNVNFSTMYVYYHIKAGSERDGMIPQKSDYHGLKRIMDDLVRQKILVATEDPSTTKLTGLALDILLKHLIGKNLRGEKAQETADYRKRQHYERSHEVRKFRSGDTYRNISVRRTLREVARQRKSLSDVRQADFRVFMTQSCKPKSDIVLCLDTSGSMGFNQKLMYARLAAAGMAQAGLKDGNRVGIVAFNDYGKVAMPLTECDQDSLLDFIAKVSPRGNTNIGDGIKFSAEALFRNYSRNQKHIIVITDGLASAVSESTLDTLTVLEGRDLTEESALLETKKATAKGIQVSVVHIAGKDEASGKFINTIARLGNGKVYRISDSRALTALLC